MTTATVVAQQSENFGRFPAASCSSAAAPGTQLRMNDTHQPQPLHTSDTSPRDQNTNGTGTGGGLAVANLALHGGASGALNANSNGSTTSNGSGTTTTNNNNNNNGTGKSRTMSLSDSKIDHLLRDQQREQQREQHQSSHHQQQSSQQREQQQHHQHPLQNRLRGVSPTPSEQQYALKWNDFQSSILSSFRHLRDEEDFVDVTIACDSRSFTAHKVVLSACSPYFRKLLKANPCEHPIVILRDVRSEDIENLLRFMYNGEVHIGQDQLSDFLKTAQLLQVRGLADVTTGNPTGGRTSANSSMLNSSLSTPAVQELKASPTSTSLPWELPDDNNAAPPPQKRTKSSELYRKQHGLSPDDPIPLDLLPIGQHPLTRERDRSKDKSKQDHHHRGTSEHDLHHHHHHRERDRSLELRESLLGQALEGGPTLTVPSKHPDLLSLQAVASGEDSNSSDTAASDHGDDIEGLNGNIEHTRPSFPFLGLQGIPGLIPGPSGMHGDNFVSRRSLEMRVRATDPRPCPKCGKIYRSAHTLRTHLEDKHTVCPGYRCVLCGTVAKSRNSLHSHMSRQHRGISTKDLPVLPMPSPFDPELASRLLAKAGVKISPAELRARASPTGTRRNDGMKLELRSGDGGEDFDDPEDLTMSQSSHSESQRRFHESMMGMSPTGFNHLNSTTITRVRPGEGTPKLSLDGLGRDGGNGNGGGPGNGGPGGNGNGGNGMGGTDRHGGGGPGGPMNHMQSNTPTGSAILDTYLQFITENAFGMSGMTQEQAAAAALQAAKIAHLKTLGHNLDQLPPGFLPPQLDLAKLTSNNNQNNPDLSSLAKLQSSPNVTIEPTGTGNRSNETDRLLQTSNHQKLLALAASGVGGPGNNPGNHGLNNNNNSLLNSDAIRRGGSSEPMDLGLDGSGAHDDDGNSSADERNYSDDESIATH
ncbi:protein abrupt-like isoform X5 [Anopheles funestus]|uniref:protein abrupt-like isoform X5 n=1 Tax=Anopheles funestus TaxID=62324 RepID=UPI0020C6F791|nr:protein abrupt-like isoform X5 [Anopheles funestus]